MEGLRLLIVDGNTAQATEKAESLATLSHSAYTVTNLEEALEALAIERFDVLLVSSDIARPEELERRLAEAGVSIGSSLSVVSITPGSDPADLETTLSQLKERAKAFHERERTLFQAKEFQEMCAGESGLMVEIIDLFLREREVQIPEMVQALQKNDFEHLSDVAHTLKGSLGSLHSPIAWDRAQQLESAAKSRNAAECEQTLVALESDLAQLEPQLLAFREACLPG